MTVHQTFEADLAALQIADQLRPITGWLASRKLNQKLRRDLNKDFPVSHPAILTLANSLREAFAGGHIGKQVDATTVYQHIADPSLEHSGFSIDAVVLTNVRGRRHRHPRGEIDFIIGIDEGARFDGMEEGWLVYPPDSRHSPTVTGGSAIILFLLPGGEMAFD